MLSFEEALDLVWLGCPASSVESTPFGKPLWAAAGGLYDSLQELLLSSSPEIGLLVRDVTEFEGLTIVDSLKM